MAFVQQWRQNDDDDDDDDGGGGICGCDEKEKVKMVIYDQIHKSKIYIISSCLNIGFWFIFGGEIIYCVFGWQINCFSSEPTTWIKDLFSFMPRKTSLHLLNEEIPSMEIDEIF